MSTHFRMLVIVGVVIGTFAVARHSQAAPRTWIGGNVDWNDGAGNNANWNPANEPTPADEAIFNTPNSVNLGTANSIAALTMSAGIDLNTNGQDLSVAGLVQLVDASTNLIIGGGTSIVTAQNVTINSGGQVQLNGGALTVVDPNVITVGILTVNAGGTLSGFGNVNLNDLPLAVATTLNNNSTISAQRSPLIIFDPPPAGTLAINASNTNTRVDLDGTGEAGVVNVFRNQTLDINVPLADIFNGDINLFQNSTLDISSSWTLGTGTIDVNNGATGIPVVPAGVAHISGGAVAQNGGTITVLDTDGTLQLTRYSHRMSARW